MSIRRIVFTALIGFLAVMSIAIGAQAADEVINATITDVKVAVDKNGSEYVRAIIAETRTLGGVTYEAGVPVMFFGDQVAAGKALKTGDTLKCVADGRDYNGGKSYTVRAMIE